ncbi:MAG: macro domain-containing protein, partial [Candidatus Saccharibacteria bacterium]|nr:macro domain-containing protein [Candidatus Saccharibacteria bacterium]
MEYKADGITWIVCNGNIAEISADAIVCAANSMGLMRGGASQALRIKGGDVVEDAARRLAPIRIGSAVVTTAGQLDAEWVIHA